jgi:hypothetical protein
MDRILDPDQREQMISRCQALAFGNGAVAAARLLEEMVVGIGASQPLSWETELVRRI